MPRPKITLNITKDEFDATASLVRSNGLLTIHRVARTAFRRRLRDYLRNPRLIETDIRKEARHG